MKQFINKAGAVLMVITLLYTTIGSSLAQYDDYNYDSGSYNWDTGSSADYNYNNDSYNYNVPASNNTNYSDWTYQNINDYNYNYGSYTNPNVDVVGTDCIGCGGSVGGNYSDWTYQNINDYNYNYGSYTNPNVDVVGTDCIGCGSYGTPSYVEPIYTSPTYTSPTYTSPTYTSPVYTYPSYTSPSYTTPAYSYPSYTTPSYTYPPSYQSPAPYPTYAPTPVYSPTPTYAPAPSPIPVTTTTRCSDGSTPSPIYGCTRTTTIPVTTNTICADGHAPINGSCIRTNTIPVTTTTICADGSHPSPTTGCNRVIVAPVTTTQQCWDGSVIPLQSVCPSQYKTCPNGTSIPVNQTCPTPSTYVPYVPAPQVKFNNVITSVATEITLTSARCNGIGLIASGANSTGWFEYGETANLGRETGKANIGSSPTAPFSNVLTNLKPTTKYYCRAVMQNQYGTVKGEIVAFTTKSKAVSYVKPVVKTTTVKTTTVKKPVVKNNEVICIDGTTTTVQSKTAADLINAGQKLVTLQIEKVSGTIAPNSLVIYKVTVKNISDEALKGVTVKVTIPQEIVLTNASMGNYDPSTHTLTVTGLSLPAYGEAVINWTGMVDKNAPIGNSTVTTAYSNYSVPGSNAQDEVTAYVVGSVVTGSTVNADTGAKKVVGATSTGGFLPNTLVEWLALIAIIFIIFILARSVYTSYKSDKKGSH